MKKLYSLLVAALLAAGSYGASAQGLRFGIEVGGTISHSDWDYGKDIYKTKSIGGFTAGITLDYEIFENGFIQTGLVFLTKGAKSEALEQTVPETQVKFDERVTFRPMYLQIPVTVAYKVGITPGIRVFGMAGLYAAQGLTGEYTKKTEYSSSTWEDKEDSSSPFGVGKLKRFDAGVKLGGGFEFGKLVLKFSYDMGLPNLVKDETVMGVDNFKNRSMAITAGLRF